MNIDFLVTDFKSSIHNLAHIIHNLREAQQPRLRRIPAREPKNVKIGGKSIAKRCCLGYNFHIMTLTEVENLAFELPVQQRATLASRILDTLPPLFTDSDDGIAEAELRNTEMNADPSKGINLAQFDLLIAQRR